MAHPRSRSADLPAFANEPFTDFTLPGNKAAMEGAIAAFKSKLGRHIPLTIGGRRTLTEERIVSINPGKTDEIVGYVAKATREHAEEAMSAALEAFESWKRVGVEERADLLLRAAALMRSRKHAFSAAMVVEAGKNWSEADADTAEAIDFLGFYAREMLRLSEANALRPLVRTPGENNRIEYLPLGVGVVVPPWNFPLAICAGMTAAAIVCGNTVVLKPSSLTPVVAYEFYSLLEEVGLPPGVVNFLPGSGADIGDYLTAHPRTRFVSFTGSKEVGLRINKLAAETAEDQRWIKRVIAEMGGKDGVVVDETADLDAAASAIVAGAFGFQGQKCSAGSRAIVVEQVYDEIVGKIAAAIGKLTIGLPETNAQIGPVADRRAYDKILDYIDVGRAEGRLIAGGGKAEGNGYYIEPTAFADVAPQARIMQEEIFGPVLAIAKAKDYKEAIEIFNDTEYGLTGSFFSKDEDRIAYALEEMFCGNLYVNRKCTGALVGVHPFGGFNMSGTDSKAGGYDYLLLFAQAKLTSRRR
ncbi:L-glutamate gamma-semialdehyde dehydrogenase [Cohnella suwonensis]|uniref:L-glutamate gamma-semialdehyde dehydrogenase n=1 Tax=Cohnella suwonensis TaxID=696072 RepID=A0ABW0LYI9_9BACL